MVFLIRGLVGLASLGVLLQVDCGTLITLSGCLPQFEPLFAALTPSGSTTSAPIVLTPTTKTTTTGVFLAVQNNTAYNIQVYFTADDQELIAQTPAGQTLKYELAPPESNTVVTAQTIDLNGLWNDSTSDQEMKFVNGGLSEFVDENGVTHVFSSADLVPGENVLSLGTVQRSVATNTVAIAITTDDPNATAGGTEARTYALIPGANGTTLTGSSTVAMLDPNGDVIDGTEKTLTHTFKKQFPNSLQATRERDTNPATGALVEDFTYSPPPAEVKAGVDYQFGQTIMFRVNATTVSFVISGP